VNKHFPTPDDSTRKAWRLAGFVTALLLSSAAWPQVDAPRAADEQAVAGTSSMTEARRIVDAASRPGAPWSGPTSGPAGQQGKTIALVAEDLRNGGIIGVAQGVREAAAVMGWSVKVFDAQGSAAGRAKALAAARASKADGLVLCGLDALENGKSLEPFAAAAVPVVGWHTGPRPGLVPGSAVATNITTDPLDVARVTAMSAIVQSGGRAGVVILTDSRFAIAMAKARVMAQVIKACAECTLLEVHDVAISDSASKMPQLTEELLARHGKRFTHALAINDIYFDHAVPTLTKAGLSKNDVSLLSAGDGSAPALLRIQAGIFQTGTVAEPLSQQGWQVIDEMNRLFAHGRASGFVAPVHLITAANIAFDGGTRFEYDPHNDYRSIYRRIWQR